MLEEIIRQLPPEQQREVRDFAEFLYQLPRGHGVCGQSPGVEEGERA
jgi:uncharacterized protein DUF2281